MRTNQSRNHNPCIKAAFGENDPGFRVQGIAAAILWSCLYDNPDLIEDVIAGGIVEDLVSSCSIIWWTCAGRDEA